MLEIGTTAEASFIAGDRDMASELSSGDLQFPQVFATSRMVALMEVAAARAMQPLLQTGQLSVGVSVSIKHTAATPNNTKVSATATFLGTEGFKNLGEFLALYYLGCKVLVTELDFYELTITYLRRVAGQNVRHVAIFFDPQTHLKNGVAFGAVVNGIHRAMLDARAGFGISSLLIMCFLRDLSPDKGMRMLEESLPYKDKIAGIGLDSAERDYPPTLFESVFAKARAYDYRVVAHAGEEGPADYVWQALELLKVERVDHGVRSIDDPMLIDRLASIQMPLTMCPFSSKRLCVVASLKEFPLRFMLEHDVCALVNSDDPAYFGGYAKRNLLGIARAQRLTRRHIFQLARNSFRASFLSDQEKNQLLAEVDCFEQSLAAAGPVHCVS